MGQQGGANAPYTRFRGPLLVGQSSDFGIAAVNGGSTAPLISFWNASEHGFYVASTAETRYVTPSAKPAMILTSGALKVGSTATYAAASDGPLLVIPQSTASGSTGHVAATNTDGGVAVIFEHSSGSTGSGNFAIYSSAAGGWMRSTAFVYKVAATTLA